MADKTVDARGANCPIPVLKAKKAIGEVPVGGTIEVLATDPSSLEDMRAFANAAGHTMVEQTQEGGVIRHIIRRA